MQMNSTLEIRQKAFFENVKYSRELLALKMKGCISIALYRARSIPKRDDFPLDIEDRNCRTHDCRL